MDAIRLNVTPRSLIKISSKKWWRLFVRRLCKQ